MKTYEMEANIHEFLSLALDEDKQWASRWPLSVKQKAFCSSEPDSAVGFTLAAQW
jgi:hypothetical protein